MGVYEVTDNQTGKTYRLEGDSPPTEQELGEIFASQTGDPSFIDKAVGVGEVVRTMGQSAYADVAGGVSGAIHGLRGGAQAMESGGEFSEGFGDAGVEQLQNVQQAYGYQPQTEKGREYMDALADFYPIKMIGEIGQAYEQKMQDMGQEANAGALRTSLAIAGPTAFLDFLGLKIPSAAAKLPRKLAGNADARAADIQADIDADVAPSTDMPTDNAGLPLTEEGIAQVADTVRTGKTENIAPEVNPNPEFYKAQEALGIKAEPLPGFASQNPAYRAVEGGLASVPTSPLGLQTKAYIDDVADASDRLIEKYGGKLDKGELSTRFRDESMRVVDDIYEAESGLYDSIEAALPGQTRVDANNILSFFDQKIAKLGGFQEFAKQNPRLAKMYRQLKPKTTTKDVGTINMATGKPVTKSTTTKPTYELLNDIRREIGQQLGRKADTTFKTTETGLLKAVYGRLKEDQNSVARTLDNGEALIKSADDMTIKRKTLEDNLKTLLGKDLAKDLTSVLGDSLKGAAGASGKVNINKLRSTIDALPDNFREEALVSALNDVFRGTGVNAQAFDATKFNKFMNQLNRSPATKNLLYKNLPEGAPKALENLHTVAKGVSDALGDRITTGRALFFDPKNGIIKRMLGRGIGYAAGKVTTPVVGAAISEFLNQSTDSAKAAGDLLSSPKFQNMIKESVRDGVIDGSRISDKARNLEKAVERSAAYKKWASTLEESDLAKLTSAGLVNYLLAPQQDEQ